MEEHLNRSCNFTERKHQNIHVETYQRAATAIERSGMPNMVRVSGYGFVNRTLWQLKQKFGSEFTTTM
jgi:hypothetical protein